MYAPVVSTKLLIVDHASSNLARLMPDWHVVRQDEPLVGKRFDVIVYAATPPRGKRIHDVIADLQGRTNCDLIITSDFPVSREDM